MLNENLSRLRRERGLTQEALAIKLNVVRQTISKWENGTAVPDADTLCKIADALDVPVADLLGIQEPEEKMDMTAVASTLAEINEQLAIRNRRGGNIIKAILGIVIGLFLLIAIVIVANISVGKPIVNNNSTVHKVDSEGISEAIIELDENGIPLLEKISTDNEYAVREFLGSRNISKEQLINSWGNTARENDNSASWQISDGKVITVFFTNAQYAYDCGIEDR